MAHAVVVNLTRMPKTLQAMVNGKMEFVQVPPTLHGKPARVQPHFVTWQELHPREMRVIHFVNSQGQKVAQLDAKHFPSTMPPKKEEIKKNAPPQATASKPATTAPMQSSNAAPTGNVALGTPIPPQPSPAPASPPTKA
jgi:hypothetical protein